MPQLLTKLKARIHTAKTAPKAGRDQRISKHLLLAADMDGGDVLSMLGVTDEGLTEEEAERRRAQFGTNQVAHERPQPWYRMLLANFKNPFILVLIVLGIVSFLTDDMKAVVVVSVMVTVSVLMRFSQEYRSSNAAEKLRAMVRTTATVLRRGRQNETDSNSQSGANGARSPLKSWFLGTSSISPRAT